MKKRINFRKLKKRIKNILLGCLGLLLGMAFIFPVVLCFLGGLESDRSFNNLFIPKDKLTLKNYEMVLHLTSNDQTNGWRTSGENVAKLPRIPRYVFNSFVICAGCVISQLLFCSLAAYAFAFYRFKRKNLIFFLVLLSVLMPKEMFLIANYLFIQNQLILNTYLGIILPDMISGVGIFLLRQQFLRVDVSLWDAARIDGCSGFGLYRNIYMPVSAPFLIALGGSILFEEWNSYLWPLLVASTNSMRTVSIAASSFYFEEAGSGAPVFAAIALTILPLLILFIAFSKRFIKSVELSQPWPDLRHPFQSIIHKESGI